MMKKWEYKYIEFFADIYVTALPIDIRSGNKHTIIEDGRKMTILNGEYKKSVVREHGEKSRKEVMVVLPEFVDYLNELSRKVGKLSETFLLVLALPTCSNEPLKNNGFSMICVNRLSFSQVQRNYPTKRALDAGDSAAISSIFLASSFSCSQT